MTVGGRRRSGRRGEREKENFARELDTLAHQNESELDLPDAGFVRFRTGRDAPKPPDQPPVVPTSASYSVARLVISPIFLSALLREGAEAAEKMWTVTGERNAQTATPGIVPE